VVGSKRLTEAERVEIRRRLALGERSVAIGKAIGRSHDCVDRVRREAGAPAPRVRRRPELCLSLAEREEISRGLVEGRSLTAIADGLGRSPSTVCREVTANGGRLEYRAWAAEHRAGEQALRPRAAKLACARLAGVVGEMLEARWSPQQIARRLKLEYPDEPEMWVSHETIYQSLFVQGRGSLRKELHRCLRSGRAARRTRGRRANGAGHIPNMVMISERPAEVEDRAVPGHWEGDLIMGTTNRSAIGTLVERHTRYVELLHLPNGHTAAEVRDAMTAKIRELPEHLRRSVTWDQGTEMAQHAEFTIDTGVHVYFCDPHSPWQRGSNENTNGLLRQYFPKGTDLAVHTAEHLDAVAAELNGRPRQTLGWMKPSEKLAELIAPTA
jgi:transposase, IS30 family